MRFLEELKNISAVAEVSIAKAQAEDMVRRQREALEQAEHNRVVADQRISKIKEEMKEAAAAGHRSMTLYTEGVYYREPGPTSKTINSFIYDWAIKEFGYSHVRGGSYEEGGDDGWPRTTVRYVEVVW